MDTLTNMDGVILNEDETILIQDGLVLNEDTPIPTNAYSYTTLDDPVNIHIEISSQQLSNDYYTCLDANSNPTTKT
jgi:hypothetical protein